MKSLRAFVIGSLLVGTLLGMSGCATVDRKEAEAVRAREREVTAWNGEPTLSEKAQGVFLFLATLGAYGAYGFAGDLR